MEAFYYTSIVTLLSILLTIFYGFRVGRARAEHDVKAPDCVGPHEFNLIYRAHQNTLEMMILFLPSLWICAAYTGDATAGILGGVWLLGRILYAVLYVAKPEKRGLGFMISFIALVFMIISAFKEILL